MDRRVQVIIQQIIIVIITIKEIVKMEKRYLKYEIDEYLTML